MDTLSPRRRSQVMANIRSSGTKPERQVRSALHRRGFRFGSGNRLPGRPDVVMPARRTVVFVHGCFWHGHEGCQRARAPKTNVEWWVEKVRVNRQRDNRVARDLVELGWRVLVVWTCELRTVRSATETLDRLAAAIATREMSGRTEIVAAA
ncbi:MAG TPA: DNA mismatch endonuclease Vsr [candidate division Zixibacteria bacterium]|nr:DNA mismatch endonuclease Vsr [candidate division Zixibacteria bacterium]